MQQYRVIKAIAINSGKVGLSAKQAATRSHMLIATDEPGVYLPGGTLCFKAGEVIGLDVVSKAMASSLELIEQGSILTRDIPGKGKEK